MHNAAVIAVFIVAFVSAISEVKSSDRCSCTSFSWDCSKSEKTIILPSEWCANAQRWEHRINNLQVIPQYGSTSVRYVDLSYNELGVGTPDPVRFPSLLFLLDVSSNSIKSLSFLDGTSTTTLIAADNIISDIKDYYPVTVSEDLYLSNNNITELPSRSFVNNLKTVDLSGNPLVSISESAFGGLSNLEVLFLNKTRLTTLPNAVFNDTPALTFLSLRDGVLESLPKDVFSPLGELQKLELQGNNLRELDESLFRNLVNVKSLNLDQNRLGYLPKELFSRLHSLVDLTARDNALAALPSLQQSSGPLVTALFSDNAIKEVDETAVRALLRAGFQFADLRKNPVRAESMRWAEAAHDTTVTVGSNGCVTITLIPATHGSIAFCPVDNVP